MRIHTSLSRVEVSDLLGHFDGRKRLEGVWFEILSVHGSRKRDRAFEIRLAGNGTRVNSGAYGAGDWDAATWDEWGVFFARLYKLDPEAICGTAYSSADDYHFQTGDRFRSLELPADTHKRHKWENEAPYRSRCTKCSARTAWEPRKLVSA